MSAISPRSRHRRGFWIVTALFAATMAFATVPTPLYVIYQREQGFGAFMVTVIFAAYALGVVVSLLLAGHLSDYFGRRRVIAPAVVLNVLSALVFIVARRARAHRGASAERPRHRDVDGDGDGATDRA